MRAESFLETGGIRFRRIRFQTPNSVSFLPSPRSGGESSVSSLSAYCLWAKANSTSSSQKSPNWPQNSMSSFFANSAPDTVFSPFPSFMMKRLCQRVPNGVFQTVFFRFLTWACNRGNPHQRNRKCRKTPLFSSILVPSALAGPDHPLNTPFRKTPFRKHRLLLLGYVPFLSPEGRWHIYNLSLQQLAVVPFANGRQCLSETILVWPWQPSETPRRRISFLGLHA